MKKVHIDFFPDNLLLILEGKKVSTLRSSAQAAKIGLEPQEQALLKIEDKSFTVTYHGQVWVSEIGGRDAVWANEGFNHTPPKFQQTLEFLDNKIPLHYYTLKEIP